MFLEKLKLLNFRNHLGLDLKFDSRLNFFVGNNGEGKTNILEAISILSSLKSFRDNSDEEIINWNTNNFFIKAEFTKQSQKHILEIGFEKAETNRKKIKLNQDILKKRSDAIGVFQCVILSPIDLKIIESGPSERRKFIDSFISSFDREYLNVLVDYNKILKHRNSLLKFKKPDPNLFETWNTMLVDKGILILSCREEFISKLNILFNESILMLSGNKDSFSIEYKPNIKNREDFLFRLNQNLQRDIHTGHTSVGIHRDEIFIGENNRDVMEFASQGQKRCTVISLKTAVFNFLKEQTGEPPVLIIDDVIRELDIKRREYFVELIVNAGQAFFSTTDLEGIQDYIGNLKESKKVFLINAGTISELD